MKRYAKKYSKRDVEELAEELRCLIYDEQKELLFGLRNDVIRTYGIYFVTELLDKHIARLTELEKRERWEME